MDYYGDDTSDYSYSNMSFEYSDNETYEGSLNAHEQGNETHEYNGEPFYWFDSSRDYDRHGE